MRAWRSVTLTPTGMPSRSLKAAIDLRARRMLRLLAGDRGELLLGRVEHVRVLLGLAHPHVQGDLLDTRDLPSPRSS